MTLPVPVCTGDCLSTGNDDMVLGAGLLAALLGATLEAGMSSSSASVVALAAASRASMRSEIDGWSRE